MSELIFLFIGIFLGTVGTYFAMRKRKTVCELHGVASYVERQQTEKQLRKERIIEMLKKQSSITNDDIEGPLGISHPTAAAYLRELVDEGKLEMIGERGRFVSYRIRNVK